MTCITNVILTTAIQDGAWMNSDYGSVDELNEYLCNNYQGSTLKMVHCHAGGNKGMSCDVFMAAIDYLNIEEFIKKFNQVQWDKSLAAQLFLKSESDNIFQSYSPE